MANVYGKALYLEFTDSSNGVLQFIMTPDIIGPEGRFISQEIYRRRVSSSKPRTTWKAYNTYTKVPMDGANYIKLSNAMAQDTAKAQLSYANSLFKQILDYKYVLRNKPIVVEISVDDLDDIAAQKTPYKLLNRIMKSRKALNFPDALID